MNVILLLFSLLFPLVSFETSDLRQLLIKIVRLTFAVSFEDVMVAVFSETLLVV